MIKLHPFKDNSRLAWLVVVVKGVDVDAIDVVVVVTVVSVVDVIVVEVLLVVIISVVVVVDVDELVVVGIRELHWSISISSKATDTGTDCVWLT